MSKGQHTFKQGDFTKALKGAVNAGLNVKRAEIDKKTGNIVLQFTGGDPPSSSANEWDDVK
jgi:hypothetical protein